MPESYRRYAKIDLDKLGLIKRALREAGLNFEGKNPWTLRSEEHGVEIQATWFKDSDVLFMEIMKKPWVIPDARIWSEITKRINKL